MFLVNTTMSEPGSFNATPRPIIIFWGSSGHSNFMNPFEYGKSFLDRLFPKRFGTLTETKPKIHRGGRYAPPLVFRYAQIGRGK